MLVDPQLTAITITRVNLEPPHLESEWKDAALSRAAAAAAVAAVDVRVVCHVGETARGGAEREVNISTGSSNAITLYEQVLTSRGEKSHPLFNSSLSL